MRIKADDILNEWFKELEKDPDVIKALKKPVVKEPDVTTLSPDDLEKRFGTKGKFPENK